MHGRRNTVGFVNTTAYIVHLVPLFAYHFSDLHALRPFPISRQKRVCDLVACLYAVASGIECRVDNAPNRAFFQIVFFVHDCIYHIAQSEFQFLLFGKDKRCMFSAYRHTEYSLSILRYAVIFGIKYLPIVRVTERRQKRKPTVKVGFEFLAYKVIYVFKQ